MRILITGSRTWRDREKMAEVLGPWFSWDNILISGHCPSGADLMAEELWAGWLDMPVVTAITEGYIEIYPADWSLGKGAGHLRNQVMVDTDPDACLVFLCQCFKPACKNKIAHPTHGGKDCAVRAERAGIPVTWTSDD